MVLLLLLRLLLIFFFFFLSPMRNFVSLMEFSQSALFFGH
jgi:hypothetical protein